jgi:hypothetical protein
VTAREDAAARSRWEPGSEPGWTVEVNRRLDGFWMEHRGGVSWMTAPVPHRLHLCAAQTRGVMQWFTCVERCACGAMRMDGRRWTGRNERRRG